MHKEIPKYQNFNPKAKCHIITNDVTIIMPAPLGVGLLWLDRSLGRSTNFLDMRNGIIALIAIIFIIRLTKKLNIKM